MQWLQGFATALGGPGLFLIAFLDSSFLSFPEVNDLLIIYLTTQHPHRMPYYALMATLGSIAGCYVIYYVSEKGGEAFLRKRLRSGHIERALAMYRRYGLLALVVPALLPPPAPFKLFVLMAGVAGVPPLKFIAAIGIARGLRYLLLGVLAILYGDLALEYMRTHGRTVGLVLAGLIVLAAIAWWAISRQRRPTA